MNCFGLAINSGQHLVLVVLVDLDLVELVLVQTEARGYAQLGYRGSYFYDVRF
jgi:hypothetical protein